MPRFLLMLLLLLPGVLDAAVIHVTSPLYSIQAAINATQDGDTVRVGRGGYHEHLVIPLHEVTLASDYLWTSDSLDIAGTVLDGNLTGTVITVLAGERWFHLNGFIITGGWARITGGIAGGGIWAQECTSLEVANVVFSGNDSEWPGGFGAAAYGGYADTDLGSLILSNVQITDNNHELPHTLPLTEQAMQFRCTGPIRVRNLLCLGAGLEEAAIQLDAADSLFVDSVRVVGYVGNTGSIAGFNGRNYAEVNHVLIRNNVSSGGALLGYGCSNAGGVLRTRDILITQNTDSSEYDIGSSYRFHLGGDDVLAEDIVVRDNRITTGYLIDFKSNGAFHVRNLVIEDNVLGSATTYLDGYKGRLAYFENVALDSALFTRNHAHLALGPIDGGYGLSPLVAGSYLHTNDLLVDTLVWRKVRFRDNSILEYTNPADKRNGIQGRTIRFTDLTQGALKFVDCEWVNNRTNLIAPEVDDWLGYRNVGSTVEIRGSEEDVPGTDIVFQDCLFQDNDDGCLFVSDFRQGLISNCQFIRNDRYAIWFYTNNDNGYSHIRNTWIHETRMQEYFLTHPQSQGVFHIHGDTGALVENVTVSACSTSFFMSLGFSVDSTSYIRNSLFWDNDYVEFVHTNPDGTPFQEGDFSYCLADHLLPGAGNIALNPEFDAYLGPPYLSSFSPAIDAGDPTEEFQDEEDPLAPGFAKWPSQGGWRNDIGVTGGPYAMAVDTNWAVVPQPWKPNLRPRDFSLGAPWPNPFNPVSRIPFTLLRPLEVRLSVHNLLGQEVAVLVDRVLPAGRHETLFRPGRLASGLYLVTLEAGGRAETRTVTLLR